MAASTSAQHARRTVLSGAHSCDADDKEVLRTILKTTMSDASGASLGSDDR